MGSEGAHEEVLANPGPNGRPRFARGSSEEVVVDAGRDLGDILRVTVWHTGQVRAACVCACVWW